MIFFLSQVVIYASKNYNDAFFEHNHSWRAKIVPLLSLSMSGHSEPESCILRIKTFVGHSTSSQTPSESGLNLNIVNVFGLSFSSRLSQISLVFVKPFLCPFASSTSFWSNQAEALTSCSWRTSRGWRYSLLLFTLMWKYTTECCRFASPSKNENILWLLMFASFW